MTSKIGPKGQVVIPKPIRDELGIMPGDEVIVELLDGAARVTPARLRGSLKGRFKGHGLLEELMKDRAFERELEERREAKLDEGRGDG